MIVFIVAASIIVFLLGYRFYGGFLCRQLQLDDSCTTPACEMNDGVDYCPAKPSLLLGQHFSAISAAGPIVGPVLAAVWFGWLPALLWIVVGAIFVGGVHDFTSLVASIRHKASSIGELVKEHMSPTSHILFLTFVWFTLVYVIIAFTDVTAQTFTTVAKNEAYGPAVAASSVLYLLLGVVMGILLYKFKVPLTLATVIFVPLVLVTVWLGTKLPESFVSALLAIPLKQWEVGLLVYCFIASLVPMWLLLQPRGYLGGWFLYLTIATGLLGALFGGYEINYPALNLDGLRGMETGKLVFPLLFITVACGACSGFHGIVSSGTTSKQLSRESDARSIGYGSMLLEGLVAVLALATVMMLKKGDATLSETPNFIYASGLARYLEMVGINFSLALTFALLAFSTFVYDTLDVCTRLARYILQELVGWKSWAGAFAATFVTLLIPLAFLMLTEEQGYLVAWPIFGTSNQLLASLILLAISVWLIRIGRSAVYALIPMAFMMVVTMWSLILLFTPFLSSLAKGVLVSGDAAISGVCGIILFVLALWLVWEAFKVLVLKRFGKTKAEPVS